MSEHDIKRCDWAGDDPLLVDYHDREWGVPAYDECHLFEMLNLEGAQAGLSWRTVLHKRQRYREVFAGFDPVKVARFTDNDVACLLQDPGIVRNRRKIEATVANARALLALTDAGEDFCEFLWQFVDHVPVQNRPRSTEDVPSQTAQSRAMSKALKAHGFAFVGPTICYAFMQAVGMVDDHLSTCFRSRPPSGRRRPG